MENYTFCEKITPKRPVKRPIIRSQKYRICNHNFFSRFSINGWTEFVSAYIPAKSALSLLSLRHKIVGLHTFLRNGWTECVLQCTFCPSISQKCVRPLNLVPKWLEFEGFRPLFGFRAFMSGLSLHVEFR